MNTKLRDYIETLFQNAPQTVKTVELKEEMIQNLTDKYNDLISQGKTEDAAYNIAVASIGDISGLVGSLQNPADQERIAAARKRTALLRSIAIALYILCPVPCILFAQSNEIAGVVLLFVFIAVATGLLIYDGCTKNAYVKTDDTVVEEFREWQQAKNSRMQACNSIIGAMWLIMVAAYFLISFATGAWHVTWLIFLISAAFSSIIKGAFELSIARKENK